MSGSLRVGRSGARRTAASLQQQPSAELLALMMSAKRGQLDTSDYMSRNFELALAPALAAPTAALLRSMLSWRTDLGPMLPDGLHEGADLAYLDALDAVDPPLGAQLVGAVAEGAAGPRAIDEL